MLVAMSGGVDSSVAAAMLLREGFGVVGATLRLWSYGGGEAETAGCAVGDGIERARSVAQALGIEHTVVEASEVFREQVLRPCWEEYDRGRTPNPCVLCNARMKFGTLLDRAREMGCEAVATGHHARLIPTSDGARLERAKDPGKDQSYFLAKLDGPQRDSALMPVGDLHKAEVRSLAARWGLPTAGAAESQDACITGAGQSFSETLRLFFRGEERPGRFVDTAGREVGRHAGIHRFTIGQRRGLGVGLGYPAYVVAIDPDTCDITVGPGEGLWSAALLAGGVSWSGKAPTAGLDALVQVRSRHGAAPARVEPRNDGTARVRFAEPQRALTPGQTVVFYDGDRVLGEGTLWSAQPDDWGPA